MIKVVKSIHDINGILCVDILSNKYNKFSFKSFRRDPEDNSGWYPYGPESFFSYNSCQEAEEAAKLIVPWMVSN